MSQSESDVAKLPTCNVDDLPPEMLEHIFSFLPLYDRKSASLVCRSWCRLAFSYRGMALVQLIIQVRDWNEKRDWTTLRMTTRPYRHLVLVLREFYCSESNINVIVPLLDDLGSNVESFILWKVYSPKEVKDFVARMPNLKQLIIGRNVGLCTDGDHDLVDPETLPVLRNLTDWRSWYYWLVAPRVDMLRMAPNISKLSVDFGYSSIIQERSLQVLQRPQLKHLELYTWYFWVPIEKLNFTRLHTLKLWGDGWANEEGLLQVFSGAPGLKTVYLQFYVTAPVLKAITEKCPQLTTLGLKAHALGSKCFSDLGRLTGLKVIFMEGSLQPEGTADCNPLASVETLSITLADPYQESPSIDLKRLFPNLHTLQADPTYRILTEDGLIKKTCSTLLHLNRLTTESMHMCNVEKMELLIPVCLFYTNITKLVSIEELTLSCLPLHCNVSESCLFVKLSSSSHLKPEPRSNLKRLKLMNCHWITSDGLMKLLKLFPGLQYLEIIRFRMITQEDIWIIKKMVPDCVVHFSKCDKYYEQHRSLQQF